jgi:hypothetical protein
MSFVDIDPQVYAWADRHGLRLVTTDPSGEVRSAYLSSVAGECFQIWIEFTVDGSVAIHAAGVDSRRDDLPPADWVVKVSEIDHSLDEAVLQVIRWMSPSKMHRPPIRRSPKLNLPQKVARRASQLARFVRQYERKAQPSGDPNDRKYDKDVAKQVKRMPPDELERLLRNDEDT